jgi:hypothetical protein
VIFVNSLGPEHPNAIKVSGNYAGLLKARGKSPAAIAAALAALKQPLR